MNGGKEIIIVSAPKDIQNIEKFTLSANLKRRSIIRYPTTNDVIIMEDATSIPMLIIEDAVTISKSAAPKTTGTLIKNDITRADFWLTPLKSRVAIVVPDLDIPGRMEKPWANPKTTMSPVFTSSIFLYPFSFDDISNIPVTISKNPIRRVASSPLLNELLIKMYRGSPVIAVETVEITTILKSFDFRFSMLKNSLLNFIKTARVVPICRKMATDKALCGSK